MEKSQLEKDIQELKDRVGILEQNLEYIQSSIEPPLAVCSDCGAPLDGGGHCTGGCK